jgi:peptide/nickel transport system ATP-binding protein
MPSPGDAGVPSWERPPLKAIAGQVPSPLDMPAGCAFAPRCEYAEDACTHAMPDLVEISAGHRTRCRRWQYIGSKVMA